MDRLVTFREATLDDILAEPIVHLLMHRDGVDPGEVRALMRRLRSARGEARARLCPGR